MESVDLGVREHLDDLFTVIYEYPLWLQLLILLCVGTILDSASVQIPDR
jgi:hypothetical protein